MARPEELSRLIRLSERVRSAVDEAQSFKSECSELGKQVDHLTQMLRSLAFFIISAQSLCDHSIHRIAADVSMKLERALALARKCKHHNILRLVIMTGSATFRKITMTGAATFRKITNLLDDSIEDLQWLLIVLHEGTVRAMELLPDRIEVADELASLARDNDGRKKIIVEEGGVPPLLKLLKQSSAPNAREAAMTALRYLANDQGRVPVIGEQLRVETILQIHRWLSKARTIIEDRQSKPMPDHIIKANNDFSKRTR